MEQIDGARFKIPFACSVLLLLNYCAWLLGDPGRFVESALVVLVVLLVLVPLNAGPGHWYARLALVALAVICLGTPTGGWDARSIWLFHAKRIFVDRDFFSQLDGYSNWSHNDYPIFIPVISASLARVVGYWNEIYPKVASVFALVPAFLLFASVSTRARGAAMLIVAAVFVCSDQLISGYMDGLLAVYFACAGICGAVLVFDLVSFQKKGSSLFFYGCTLFFWSSLSLIKNEGLVLFMILAGSTLMFAFVWRSPRRFACLSLVILSLVLVAIWKYLVHRHGIVNDLAGSDLKHQLMGRLFDADAHLLILRRVFWQSTFLVPFALYVISVWLRGQAKLALFYGLPAFGYAAVLYFVYLSTPHDLHWHLATSADRVIFPVGLMLLFYCVFAWETAPETARRATARAQTSAA
ncbi:hypothetical protein [Paraburkholderia sp. JHI869]|uniref:hypothetical protein n=1 Tax=Paraburkholderia sp. JHI869 TaxID=3112959 RepID=UPI003171E4AC